MACIMSTLHLPRRWPGGVVPFSFNAGSFGNGANADVRQRIDAAVAQWNGHGLPVRWEPRTLQPNFVLFTMNPIPDWSGLESSASSSASQGIGMVGGMQLIFCSAEATTPTVMHEMGHAVGLLHEQNRADRDEHVQIVWSEIELIHRDQFLRDLVHSEDFGPYDFASLMHYGLNAYARRRNVRTIRPLDALGGVSPGNGSDLSAGDIAGLEHLYRELNLVSFNVPSFTAFTYPAQMTPPPVTVTPPSITVTPAAVTVNPPAVRVGRKTYSVPSFSFQPPSLQVTPPALSVTPPPVALNQPGLVVTPPPVQLPSRRKPRRTRVQPPPLRVDPPSVTVQVPAMSVTPPALQVNPPSVDVTPPSFKVGLLTVKPPSLRVDLPAFSVQPPALQVQPPPLTLDPPAFEVSPPALTVVV